ncbi:MAG: DNA polymerase III subunit gamma/tau [Pseudomonadota bacterium]
MSYQVLARKWRPRNFQEMMGQEHVLRALINALDSQRLHHAYLFTGTRGVGKTTVARIFAKSLNCEQGITSRPCGICGACREIDEGRFVDLIEVDAASRTKVEDTRELLENVQYSPTSGRYKVYLIDEVHMLSTHSFNALLKTLEEPPPHVKFLLATTDPQRLPVTILSRCLQFNLKRMAPETIRAHLAHVLGQESITAEPAALSQLARAADGSMRDALSLLDQAIAFGGGQVTEADVRIMLGSIEHAQVVALAEALAARDGAALLRHSAELAEFAPDYGDVLAELISLLYHVAVVQAVPAAAADETYAEAAARLAGAISPEDVQLFYQIALIGRRDLSLAPAPRSGFEMVLLRMLAFVPAAAGEAAASAPPAAAAPRHSAPVTAVPVMPAPVKAAAVQVAAPSAPRAPAMPASSQSVAGGAPAAAHADDWNTLIDALRLHGIARELAVNCSLKARDGDVFHLVIAPVHASLRNARLEQRLQESLSTHLGRPVKLVFSIAAPEAETPALMKERVSQDRLRAAQESIAQDGNVKTLQEMFEARVVPESVQPVD